MKGKLILTLGAIIGMVFSTNVYAQMQNIYIEKNFSTGRILISGESEKADIITIQIIPDGTDIDEFAKSTEKEKIVLYANDYECGEDGKFEFNINAMVSGSYRAFINGEKSNMSEVEIGYFASKTDYEKAIEDVNLNWTENFEKSMENLGFSAEINKEINISEVRELMYNELGEDKKLSASEYDNNIDLYKKCAAIVALNDGKLKNVTDYVKFEDKTFNEFLKKHADTEQEQEFLTKKMTGRAIKDIEELKEIFNEALILTAVKYPNGYMNIKEVFEAYKDVLGISSVSLTDSVYKQLAEKGEFFDVKELVSEYKKLVEKKVNINSHGGSAGGGGGNRVSNPGAVSEIKGQTTGEKKQELTLKFTDLGSVLWAYSSISVLYEKGIVNGVSDTEYMPEGLVTREQFVKMLILSMNLEISNESAGFSDVDRDSWYADFVNTAYVNNIVNGISDAEFGVGRNITRQDMAVMIYNAMVKCGFSGAENDATFKDDAGISDYARESVSKLSKIGIINGVGDNMFAPQNTATRAEAAVITERALQYLQK